MRYRGGIKRGLDVGLSHNIIARKIFLSYPTSVFIDNEDIGFEICNQIADYFKLPITSIQVVGSSKIGYTIIKDREFKPGKSDLDIAIIDLYLFNKYMELVYKITKGYSDLTKFPLKNGVSTYNDFIKYLSKGIFRPDLMPRHRLKIEWFTFFNKISEVYFHLFKDINAGIYSSHFFFEHKQSDIISKFSQLQGGKGK